jgi:uncharacterized repeat protein (TIGR03943 family)
MSLQERRGAAALLGAVGAMSLRLGFGDDALAWVKSGMRPLLAVAGSVLLGLAALTLLRPDRGETHGHAGHARVGWLLALPVVVALAIHPGPLGAYTASGTDAVRTAPSWLAFEPLAPPQDGAVPMPLAEFADRALFDRARSLDGVRVRLYGFVTPPRAGTGGYTLTRFAISCCAADGVAIKVAVEGDPNAHPSDSWLRVEGHWKRAPVVADGEGHTPVLVADKVTPIDAPSEPYEQSYYPPP